VVTHGPRGFGDEAAIPVIGMQSVTDFDVFDAIFRMIKETAVTDNCVPAARDDGKLRWDSGAVPAHDFLDESYGLLAFGENAQ